LSSPPTDNKEPESATAPASSRGREASRGSGGESHGVSIRLRKRDLPSSPNLPSQIACTHIPWADDDVEARRDEAGAAHPSRRRGRRCRRRGAEMRSIVKAAGDGVKTGCREVPSRRRRGVALSWGLFAGHHVFTPTQKIPARANFLPKH
jgi:hypothetical protein